MDENLLPINYFFKFIQKPINNVDFIFISKIINIKTIIICIIIYLLYLILNLYYININFSKIIIIIIR